MERRDFLKNSVAAGAAVLAAAAAKCVAGEERPRPGAPTPDEMARAAREHFLKDHRSCSEAMLLVGSQALGVESPLIPDIALGLGSGLGRQGHTCGVILGAALVAGLAAARRETGRARRKKAALAAVAEMCREFEERHGSTECRALIGLDLTTPEGRARHKAGVRRERCGQLVETGARLMAAMLAEA